MINENEILPLIKREIQKNAFDSQYSVGPVPFHAHTGTDSPQIQGSSIAGLIPPHVISYTSTATPTPNIVNTDLFNITSQTGAASFAPPVGTPHDGQILRIRITSSNSATARSLTFSSATGGYIANSPALPSATTTGKTTTLGFEYDTSNSVNKWRLLWSANS